jgi:hypothetical protein
MVAAAAAAAAAAAPPPPKKEEKAEPVLVLTGFGEYDSDSDDSVCPPTQDNANLLYLIL